MEFAFGHLGFVVFKNGGGGTEFVLINRINNPVELNPVFQTEQEFFKGRVALQERLFGQQEVIGGKVRGIIDDKLAA